jgi:hypothetical protein
MTTTAATVKMSSAWAVNHSRSLIDRMLPMQLGWSAATYENRAAVRSGRNSYWSGPIEFDRE